jgi:signal transduction histidine kinase
VYDGEGPSGDGLLYQSAPPMPDAVTTNRSLVMAGRPWALQFAARPTSDDLSAQTLALLVLVSGLVFSALLAGALYGELRARQASEEALVRERLARDQAEELAAMSRALTSTLDVARLAEMIVERVRALTGASVSILYRGEGPSGDLRLVASSGEVGTALLRGTVIPSGTGAVGRAVSERRTVFTANFLHDPSIIVPPALRPASAPVSFRSVLAMPLIAQSRVIGALAIGDRVGRTFSPEQVAVAEAFASQAATALETARLLHEANTARASAEEANRTKDEFLATVSHELRTPLNAILGWARMLRRGKLGGRSPAHALEVIERNAVTQAQLVDDLLDVSRIISGKVELRPSQVDVARVIDAAVDAVRPGAEARGIGLRTVVTTDKVHVTGDADRLQQVVWNLLSNAIKFTPRDGHVEACLEASDGDVFIVVRDTGAGIAPDVLPHVFERFRQGDSSSTRAHRGLGIGLALVKHLVDLHGGTVTAESAGIGLGATFVVRLRRSSPDAAPGRDRVARADRTGGWLDVPAIRGIRVLAVDDDADSLEVLATMLREAGANVHIAVAAEDALAVLDQWEADVVLSDLEMPGMDGFALVGRIAAHGDPRIARLSVIALTAYGRMEDRIRALSSGFVEHIAKPFDPAAVVSAILAAVGRR